MTPPIPGRPALFLDVDGTLLPLNARLADARPDGEMLDRLTRLSRALGGALALLSGRSLAALAELFEPVSLPAAGLHGLERRRVDGEILRTTIDDACLAEVRSMLSSLVAAEPGLKLEDKGEAFAVHHRATPEDADRIRRAMLAIAERLGPSFHVHPGHYVFELRPALPNKGSAVLEFMSEPPFRDRIPIAVGDDLTDLPAFRAATAYGGYGIAVSDRVRSRWHLDDPLALHAWLETVIAKVQS